jgi:hypothetical protein
MRKPADADADRYQVGSSSSSPPEFLRKSFALAFQANSPAFRSHFSGFTPMIKKAQSQQHFAKRRYKIIRKDAILASRSCERAILIFNERRRRFSHGMSGKHLRYERRRLT